jgi:hypothetical protein
MSLNKHFETMSLQPLRGLGTGNERGTGRGNMRGRGRGNERGGGRGIGRGNERGVGRGRGIGRGVPMVSKEERDQMMQDYTKVQCKPLNVITLVQDQIDYINRMSIITDSSRT